MMTCGSTSVEKSVEIELCEKFSHDTEWVTMTNTAVVRNTVSHGAGSFNLL